MKNRTITYSASPSELEALRAIQEREKRRSLSDTIRLLILREAEKILPKNFTTVIKFGTPTADKEDKQ